MKTKTVKESVTEMTEPVLPNDTNVLGNLLGGRLLHWMDMASAIVSTKHSNCAVVTVSVDNVQFRSPIKIGEVVTIRAQMTRAFNTSMEVHIEVWAENFKTNEKRKSNEAYYTFVALDAKGKPVTVPQLTPETEEEKQLYDSALRRRELRLILAGKMQAKDANQLKRIFMEK